MTTVKRGLYKILEEVARLKSKQGERMQPPATAEELDRLETRCKSELGVSVPEGYSGFLSIMNGLEWNGLHVNATHEVPRVGAPGRVMSGVVESTLDKWDHEPMRKYMVLGGDNGEPFVYALEKDEYCRLRDCGYEVRDSFASFEDMLATALEARV